MDERTGKQAEQQAAGAAAPAGRPTAPAPAPGFVMPDLPIEMFTPPGMLALADLLPVLIAYVDRDERYRFCNRAYADWLELPRSAILGQSMRELLGEETYERRRPQIAAALAGERQYFSAEFEHATRGALALQVDYVPWADFGEPAKGVIILLQDVPRGG